MANKCAAITRGGQPCKGLVKPGNEHCPSHDPRRSKARKKASSKAGRSRPSRELVEIKKQLRSLADAVLKGAVDKGDAAVCGQLLNYVIRAVGMELRVKEILDLEERLSELEAALERKGGQRYGAPLR